MFEIRCNSGNNFFQWKENKKKRYNTHAYCIKRNAPLQHKKDVIFLTITIIINNFKYRGKKYTDI